MSVFCVVTCFAGAAAPANSAITARAGIATTSGWSALILDFECVIRDGCFKRVLEDGNRDFSAVAGVANAPAASANASIATVTAVTGV